MQGRSKPPTEQLSLVFEGFDPRQVPLSRALLYPPPRRCTCLDEGEIARLDAIGGLTNERIFAAENE